MDPVTIEATLRRILEDVVADHRAKGVRSLVGVDQFVWPRGGSPGTESVSHELIVVIEDGAHYYAEDRGDGVRLPPAEWQRLFDSVHAAVRERMPGILPRVSIRERSEHVRDKAIAEAAVALLGALSHDALIEAISVIHTGETRAIGITYRDEADVPRAERQSELREAIRRDAIERGLTPELAATLGVSFTSVAEERAREAELHPLFR
jgi:hypothetical protein